MWPLGTGLLSVVKPKTGRTSVLRYKNHPLFRISVKSSHATQSSSNRSKRKRFLLRGDWTDSIQCFTVDKFTRKESKKEGKRRRSDVSENSFASANSLESFSSGSSGGSVSVDTSTPKTLWSFQERPANSKQVLHECVVSTGNCRNVRALGKSMVDFRY